MGQHHSKPETGSLSSGHPHFFLALVRSTKRLLVNTKAIIDPPLPSDESGFHRFPEHLLPKITQHLDPISLRCLSYSCRSLRRLVIVKVMEAPPKREPRVKLYTRFRNPGGEKVRDSEIAAMETTRYNASMRFSSLLPRPEDPKHLERYDILCMLHRDEVFPGKRVCRACLAGYDDEFSLDGALKKEEGDDQCRRCRRRVWLCPHIQLGYRELEETNNSPQFYEKLMREQATVLRQGGDDDWKRMVTEKEAEEGEARRKERKMRWEEELAKEIKGSSRLWTQDKVYKRGCIECKIIVEVSTWGKSKVCFPLGPLQGDCWRIWAYGDPIWKGLPSEDEVTNALSRFKIHMSTLSNMLGQYRHRLFRGLPAHSARRRTKCDGVRMLMLTMPDWAS